MNLYIYYNKSDKTKEPQGTVKANSIIEASIIASITKDLPLSEFHKIFNVEEHDRKKV